VEAGPFLHFKGFCDIIRTGIIEGSWMQGKDSHIHRTKRRSKGNTELHKAAKLGDVRKIRHLIKSDKTLLDAKNKLGETPLHYAVKGGCYAAIKELIVQGANIDVVDNNQQTALHRAVLLKNLRATERLLNAGADTIAIDIEGRTILTIIIQMEIEEEKETFLLLYNAVVKERCVTTEGRIAKDVAEYEAEESSESGLSSSGETRTPAALRRQLSWCEKVEDSQSQSFDSTKWQVAPRVSMPGGKTSGRDF